MQYIDIPCRMYKSKRWRVDVLYTEGKIDKSHDKEAEELMRSYKRLKA